MLRQQDCMNLLMSIAYNNILHLKNTLDGFPIQIVLLQYHILAGNEWKVVEVDISQQFQSYLLISQNIGKETTLSAAFVLRHIFHHMNCQGNGIQSHRR